MPSSGATTATPMLMSALPAHVFAKSHSQYRRHRLDPLSSVKVQSADGTGQLTIVTGALRRNLVLDLRRTHHHCAATCRPAVSGGQSCKLRTSFAWCRCFSVQMLSAARWRTAVIDIVTKLGALERAGRAGAAIRVGRDTRPGRLNGLLPHSMHMCLSRRQLC